MNHITTQKIQPSNSVEDIVEAIYNDLIEIKELRGEYGQSLAPKVISPA